jgi:hypothetical protein
MWIRGPPPSYFLRRWPAEHVRDGHVPFQDIEKRIGVDPFVTEKLRKGDCSFCMLSSS